MTDEPLVHGLGTRLRHVLDLLDGDVARVYADLGLADYRPRFSPVLRAIVALGPSSIGDIAGYLLLQHHSAVGLVDRAEAAGLVERARDPDNRSTVRLSLTEDGARRLEALSELHLAEVPRLASAMRTLFADFADLADDDAVTCRAAN